MKEMFLKKVLLLFIYLASLFIYSDSKPRWSWGRLAQIQPVLENSCTRGYCIEKWKCRDIFKVNSSSEECVQEKGSLWTCCLSSNELSKNVEAFDHMETPKLSTSLPMVKNYSSLETPTVGNFLPTAQTMKSLKKENNFSSHERVKVVEFVIENTTEHSWDVINSINSDEDSLDRLIEDTQQMEVEKNTSGKFANLMTYTRQSNHPWNNFKWNEESIRHPDPPAENWNARYPENSNSPYSENSMRKPSNDQVWASNSNNEPSRNFIDSRHTKGPSDLSFENYPFRSASKITSNLRKSSIALLGKTTKRPSFNEASSEQKKSLKFGISKTPAYWIRPTKSSFANPFSTTSRTTNVLSYENTNTRKNTAKPLNIRHSYSTYATERTYSSKMTTLSRKQTTKFSWNNYSETKYSRDSTKAPEFSRSRPTKPSRSGFQTSRPVTKTTKSFWDHDEPSTSRKKFTETWRTSSSNNHLTEYSRTSTKALKTSDSRRRTTKPAWGVQTPKPVAKPTKSLNRDDSTVFRKKSTETWRTNSTSNNRPKSSVATSRTNSFTTSRPNKSTTRSKLLTKKTTLSTGRASIPENNSPNSKTTKPTFDTRRINSEKFTTATPLPDISSKICGMRVTSKENTRSKEENSGRVSSILYPGSREVNNRRQHLQRIVGGKEVEPLSWPWVAALYRVSPSGGNRFLCAGSLINEYFILTAAHVFTPENLKSSFAVLLGTHTGKEAVAEYSVMYVLQHPRYDQRYYYNDIALLRLERPVTFNEFVMPVCLPSPAVPLFRDDDLLGKKVTVMGWGDESFGGVTSRVLKEATFSVQSRQSCNASYFQVVSQRFPRGITHDMLCAGSPNGGKDACQGDSGGPLTAIANGRHTQVGIVSFGYRCGDKDYPGVYTKVSSYLSWISENARCEGYDYDYDTRH